MRFFIPFFFFSTLWATVPFREGFRKRGFKKISLPRSEDILKKRFNYLYEFYQIASFISDWQVTDTADTNYGGIIEAETGELKDVIQTDNTLEAIWVWSRYGELTRDTDRFKKNIERAWEYCTRYPAWEEEGLPQQYYRVHNCAWGIAAENVYREVYKDTSYLWYRDSCADYILKHPLDIDDPHRAYGVINPFVEGWASAWLYRYGEKTAKEACTDTALLYGERLLQWIDKDPDKNLTDEMWAMSSGTVVYGICNTVFRGDTLRGKNWIEGYGDGVDTFQIWYDRKYDGFDWDNSWNVAYANAHNAMYEISHNEKYKNHHLFLTNLLLSYDTDEDGGIPASTQDPDTEDMTWVSAYLCLMGLDKLIGEPDSFDTGALAFTSLKDSMEIPLGESLEIGGIVTNFGLSPLKEVKVYIKGDYKDSVSIDLGFLDIDTIIFKKDWVVNEPGWYHLSLITEHPRDENLTNDMLSITLYIKPTAITEEPEKSGFFYSITNFSKKGTLLRYHLSSPSEVKIEIYDIQGRLIERIPFSKKPAGDHSFCWDKRVPKGIYFVLLKTKNWEKSLKLIVVE